MKQSAKPNLTPSLVCAANKLCRDHEELANIVGKETKKAYTAEVCDVLAAWTGRTVEACRVEFEASKKNGLIKEGFLTRLGAEILEAGKVDTIALCRNVLIEQDASFHNKVMKAVSKMDEGQVAKMVESMENDGGSCRIPSCDEQGKDQDGGSGQRRQTRSPRP